MSTTGGSSTSGTQDIVDITNYEEWSVRLSLFLRETLLRLLGDENVGVIDMLLSLENFHYWTDAFTHKSFDPINNYEFLETYGDKLLAGMFTKYFWEKFPNLSRHERASDIMTNALQKYMSKSTQSEFATQLGFPAYMRVLAGVPVDRNIREDSFETFCGAMAKSGDALREGLGCVLIYNSLVFIFNAHFENNPAIPDEIRPAPKIEADKLYRRVYSMKPIIVVDRVKQKSKKTGKTVDMIRVRYKHDDVSVGEGIGITKEVAETKAAQDVLDRFAKMGITVTSKDMEAEIAENQKKNIKDLLAKVQRIVSPNQVDLRKLYESKSHKTFVYMLTIYDNTGVPSSITKVAGETKEASKIATLQEFIRNNTNQ